MKYFPLIWSGLWRKPVRTWLMALSLAVGFLLYGLVDGVDSAFTVAVQRQRLDRLLVDPRFGVAPLPLSYAERIRQVPRVKDVAYTVFLLGAYQDPKNAVLMIATEPLSFFRVRNEFETSPEALQALARTRTGVILLDSLAAKNHWKVGDKVTIHSPLQRRDGSPDWTFDVVGIMRNPSNPGQFGFGLVNYEYFDESRLGGKGTVGRYIAQVDDPARSVDVGRAIDALFENSTAPTRTKTENESARTRLAVVGDVSTFTREIISAVFFAMLFLTGNTMLQSIRERSSEIAVLKVLGFSDLAVLTLVLAETLLVCASSALVGIGIAGIAFPQVGHYVPDLVAYLGPAPMSWRVVASGLAFTTGIALLSAAVPAWHALRLKVVDALAGQ